MTRINSRSIFNTLDKYFHIAFLIVHNNDNNAIDTHYCFYALLCGNHSVEQTGLFMEEKSDMILMGKGESIS